MPKDVGAAFEAAFDDAAKSSITPATSNPELSTSSPEPPPPSQEAEPETEPETAEEEPTTETDGDDDAENGLSVSADEYAEIQKNPALKKLYKGMNKAFTQKTMALAAERQSQQNELNLLAGLKDPGTRDATFAAIAAALGKNVAQSVPVDATAAKVEAAVDKRLQGLEQTFIANGFDPKVAEALAKSMGPAMTSMAKEELKSIIEAEVGPIKEATGHLAAQAFQAQSDAEIKQFWAAHPGEYSQDVENKMAILTAKFPASEAVEAQEYLEFLYRAAKPDKTVKQATKEVAERMKKAAATAEPKSGIQQSRVSSAPKDAPSNFGRRDLDKIFSDRFDDAWKNPGR